MHWSSTQNIHRWKQISMRPSQQASALETQLSGSMRWFVAQRSVTVFTSTLMFLCQPVGNLSSDPLNGGSRKRIRLMVPCHWMNCRWVTPVEPNNREHASRWSAPLPVHPESSKTKTHLSKTQKSTRYPQIRCRLHGCGGCQPTGRCKGHVPGLRISRGTCAVFMWGTYNSMGTGFFQTTNLKFSSSVCERC